VRYLDPDNQTAQGMTFIILALLVTGFDFVDQDLRLIMNYRLLCSYELIAVLPNRVYVCKRIGAAHVEEVTGEKRPIGECIIGRLWRSDFALIADLNGVLVQLHRPTKHEMECLFQ
ncbi:unnamed protein product, partial [Polarella glacialis]